MQRYTQGKLSLTFFRAPVQEPPPKVKPEKPEKPEKPPERAEISGKALQGLCFLAGGGGCLFFIFLHSSYLFKQN